MRIVIIGSGNVATVLGRRIVMMNHQVIQVYSKSQIHASALAHELGASPALQPSNIDPTADVYLLAVPDSVLYSARDWLKLENKLVAHTAGSVPLRVLEKISKQYGVLYPLQSLRKELPDVPHIPFLIDGNDDASRSAIFSFAQTLSPDVTIANDDVRRKLHLAAIVASNFSNHLYSLAQDYCNRENVDFDKLLPLIMETARRLALRPAAELQTGPAIRNDQLTVDHHREMLAAYPELLKLYEIFTDSIRKMHCS